MSSPARTIGRPGSATSSSAELMRYTLSWNERTNHEIASLRSQ
jgi:hypothetical protein